MSQTHGLLGRVEFPSDVRVVYLHHNDPIMHAMQVFLASMRIPSSRLILSGDKEQEAIDWLLSDASTPRHISQS